MILVVNAGSSSIKVELFAPDLASVLSGSVTEIGGKGRLSLGGDRQDLRAGPPPAGDADLLAGRRVADPQDLIAHGRSTGAISPRRRGWGPP